MSDMSSFHPAVLTWFERRFAEGPTPAQSQGWPQIAAGNDTLIAAPTGSGKTLAGFLVCIDALYRAAERGEAVEGATQVVYVSPLKALAVDVHQNLETPLAEIAAIGEEMGLTLPALRAEVRTGDTPPSTRAAMIKRPPNFLVTTPESLYLLVTSQRSRAALTSVTTIIVDEIHSVARDKRGSHLAITLERLERLCTRRPVRIGLSATQRPIETVARLLVGAGPARSNADGSPRCSIVDVGHRRALDVAIELPSGELEAVSSREQLGEVLDAIATHVKAHRTTLVFVNTRRMAERVAHLLAERLGDDAVAAHHGSLSRERRQRVESKLRAGELRALVATASLELGIDIGPIEVVCQIASPRSIATFLQRVGRSGHSRGGTPKGRLYPLTRDELVECTALLAGVRSGALDAVHPPHLPMDILAQQIVAECAAENWREDDLFELMRKAAPFAELRREDFDRIVELVSDGIPTGRGRVAAYLHRDQINGEVRARRGARLAALTSGGAIPETGDYRVLAEPDDTFIGTVNEDWAIESSAGDIFLLGSTSWKIRRVTAGTVRVVDAHGAPPSVPFWLGEAPARTEELSREVSDLRSGVDALLAEGGADEAITWVEQRAGVDNDVAAMVVRYLAAGRTALGVVPTLEHIVLERFFDDSGGMQLVVHAPFGGRVNRALGLALRKRFCATFDFELQAAASDDCVLLSLGPQHSFPLEDIPKFLSSNTVEDVLHKAAIFAPMWAVRWRWNLNRSLTVLRFKGGRKNPAPIQRLESDDIMGAVFPQLVACQNENPTGPFEAPDHPLVNQTMYDCLHEVMDVDSLRELVVRIERKEVEISYRDTVEPSPLAHEIVNGRPYTFLDDAPLEERRSRAITLRRGLPVEARDLAALDPDAIARVRGEAAPEPRDVDELHDLLVSLVVTHPVPAWSEWFATLVERGRALTVVHDGQAFWCAAERLPGVERLWPDAAPEPSTFVLPAALRGTVPEPDALVTAMLRGHLDVSGPMSDAALACVTGLGSTEIAVGLAMLEGEGFALRGQFDPGVDAEQWCARRLLVRIHSYTQQRLRQEIEPVTAQDFMRFLLRWQRVAPGTQREGRAGVAATIAQLQGFEIPAGVWEETVLPARVSGYRSAWLDELCMSGEVAWARLKVRDDPDGSLQRSSASASRATPVTLVMRSDLPWLLQAVRGEAQPLEPASGATLDVLDALREHGALFTSDIVTLSRRMPTEVETALWDGVARGLLTADGFSAVRRLLISRRIGRSRPQHRGLRHGVSGYASGEGRWSLVPRMSSVAEHDALAEAIAEQLLVRWGVVFRDVVARETIALPWRDIVWALRRMEARGTARGGRFVTGFAGEQFALPEAVDQLRSVRRRERSNETVRVSATDPLNLAGILMPGPRITSIRTNTVVFEDGLPTAGAGSTFAAFAAR
ncbi:MAG TPA: DEAD/DEAH box helicase [Candidatus Acidoferrales bacterium]|nr:DEAD/DEAH box helicase [Candidatus Acidoferrales bacterium]